ncbi:hypothetical protein SFMTTN_2276 [Sulfuriferula multivorans]|uniref:Uncharacterized protein n=1 Tax=Sulfuriferula multivorans TaxID=1559896 RepID=A0A401JFS7_9PROT|nr:hypothetical protein SFMTTN_2276 [Sulfuriferula multivorans]
MFLQVEAEMVWNSKNALMGFSGVFNATGEEGLYPVYPTYTVPFTRFIA